MISGATRGTGGDALGRHLARADGNEQVLTLAGRGLIETSIREQVAELTRLGSHARTRTPLYHAHADPPPDRPWTDEERSEWWAMFEAEFGLEDRPFAAVLHRKHDRAHEHRVYLRVRADGRPIRLSHDYARREKLARRFEVTRGEALIAGAHNRAVIAALERDGRSEVAAAMRASGLDKVARPRAALTPDERHQQERSGRHLGEIRIVALTAWLASDGGQAFASALAEHGLRLALGACTAQLMDTEGCTYDLRRALSAAARANGADPVRAGDIRRRLAALTLQSVQEVRRELRTCAQIPSEARDKHVPPSLDCASQQTETLGCEDGQTTTSALGDEERTTVIEIGGGGDPLGSEPDIGAAVDQALLILEADDARIAAVLAGEPYPDAASRDPAVIARPEVQTLQQQQADIVQETNDAMASAEAARLALKTWDRLVPWSTTRKRIADAAATEAERVKTMLAARRADIDDRVERTRWAASLVAERRGKERRRWLKRPETMRAREEDLLSRVLRERVVAGDSELVSLVASGGLATARELIDRGPRETPEHLTGNSSEPGKVEASATF